uniref:Tropomyosin n=1 Tax=Glossina palpalis gambiensis TaxID=67801 RepID=A0A1B0C7S3_9MUSC
MDAIKKKMQAMKIDKDAALERAALCEQQARDANLRAEKAEEEARQLQKKIQTVENELDQTQEALTLVTGKLEEKNKALQNVTQRSKGFSPLTCERSYYILHGQSECRSNAIERNKILSAFKYIAIFSITDT